MLNKSIIFSCRYEFVITDEKKIKKKEKSYK